LRTMILQDDMQTINILKPLSGAAMHDLGQIANLSLIHI